MRLYSKSLSRKAIWLIWKQNSVIRTKLASPLDEYIYLAGRGHFDVLKSSTSFTISPSFTNQTVSGDGIFFSIERRRPMPKNPSRTNYLRDGRAPIPKDERISRVMSGNTAKDSKPELLLRRTLWAEGVRGYRLHWETAPGRPDIINGCSWHRCPHCDLTIPKTNSRFWRTKFEKTISRDKTKLQELKDAQRKTMVVWECEISKKMAHTVSRIKRFIDSNSLKQ